MTGVKIPAALREFTKLRPEVEGVIQHVGRATWDLLLVDVTGLWVREEFVSKGDAEAVCASLRIRAHDGWDDPRMTRRLQRRDHWNTLDGQRRGR